jgi:hypothetical protein
MSTDVSEAHIASIFRIEESTKEETSVKGGGKQSNRLAEISDYVENGRGGEYSN